MINNSKTSLAHGLVTNSIGGCLNPTSIRGPQIGLYKCLTAPSYSRFPLSPTAVAARTEALAALRAARTELRRIKKLWRLHYIHSNLQTILGVSSAKGLQHSGDSAYASIQTSSQLRFLRRLDSYQRFIEIETGRIRGTSNLLRRKLIRDGFADCNMIDDQMAHDLGL
jgi:hypothetical protein